MRIAILTVFEDDAIDDTVASVLAGENSAVLIYITTAPTRDSAPGPDARLYEMDEPYPSALHTDLKRDLDAQRRQSDSDDMQAGLPLFERYQFLSPREYFNSESSVGQLMTSYSYIHGSIGNYSALVDPLGGVESYIRPGSQLYGF